LNHDPIDMVARSDDIDSRVRQKLEAASVVCGGAATLLGVLVLFGWTTGRGSLLSLVPGWPTMKPNTAAAFVAIGLAVVLASLPAGRTSISRVGAGLSGFVVLLAGLTLAQFLLDIDIGIDRALGLHGDVPAQGLTLRMAPATAVGFLASGIGLSLGVSGRWPKLRVIALCVSAGVGVLAVLGYAFDVQDLYRASAFSSVALHTAIGLVLVGTGGLLLRVADGPLAVLVSRSAGGVVLRLLLPVALLMPVLLALARYRAEHAGLVHAATAAAAVTVAHMVLLAGVVVYAARLVRRLDAQRQAKSEAERRQRAQLDGIINSAMDAIVVIDESQRIVLFNPAAEAMFGRTSASMIGQTLRALLPETARADHADQVRAFALEHTEVRRMGATRPVTGVRANGVVFPLEASISRLNIDGALFYTAILRDISQRQRDAQARLEAEERSKIKSSFLAHMSHEIRTPLNAVIGLAGLLGRTQLDARQRSQLEKIDTAGRHLLALVNDILDMSKIEAGQLTLERSDFDLVAVLQNVCSLVGDVASAKQLGLRLRTDAAPRWVRGDPTRLRQALLNYASNAVKFTQRGEVEIAVDTLSEDDSGFLLRFSVRDTGIGIEPQQLERLFGAFEQAEDTTTRTYGGSGLGLAITKRLADLMGGEVGVRSRPGEGSDFWFTARLHRPHTEMPEAASLGADAQQALRSHHAGARVLLAEDHPVNREIAEAVLSEAGLEVVTASNGAEALQKAQAGRYAVALLDMQMPVMGGLQAARAIRALPHWSGTPILAFTANVFEDDRAACLAAGMTGFIGKPVDPKILYGALLSALEGRAHAPVPTDEPVDGPPGSDGIERQLRLLEGLDVDYGLSITHGNPQRLVALLAKMVDHGLRETAGLAAALAAADTASALSLTHSLRGAAASVGARRLATLALQLEESLRAASGADDQDELLTRISGEMSDLRARLPRPASP
jgi:PAS domain S-box-containing protein